MLEPSRYRRHHLERPRRRGLAVLAVIALVLVLLVGALGGFYVWATGASGESQPVSIEIPKGATATDVAELLQEEGVIRSAFMFRMIARFREISVDAGSYRLATNMGLNEAIEALQGGPAPIPTVTAGFAEGLRVSEVATRLQEQLGIDGEAFRKLAESGKFSLPPWLPKGKPTVEGFLFPKTYEFVPEKVTPKSVLRRLLRQFKTEASGLPWENAKSFGLSHYEVVVVASLIEEEARVPEERGKISRVIHNRLERGMQLGIDATVQYIDPDPSNGITQSDLEIDSPYNTRLNAGIPPTPIASPGLASLEAALDPTPGPWLYFVVIDPEEGRHGFTDDYNEFLRMKAQGEAAAG